ncbi:MAG: hypothetical protein JXX28_13875 [Deltaproteobacteria bacterium]|nr:hypothetical protein [Deltaproteobacteria bacterium]
MLLLLSLLACNGGKDDTDEIVVPFSPDLPTTGCGLDYEWAPMEQMGEVVSYEHMDEYSLGADQLNVLLTQFGAGDLTPVPYGVEVYRVRYLTQDRGEVVEATGWLSFPAGDGVPEEVPTVVWTHGTSGFTDQCAPTAAGLEGAGYNMLLSALGYAVTAPDYLGMNGWGAPAPEVHSYLVSEATAVATLDSVRALWGFAEERELAVGRPAKQAVLWGGSEGGFAALWADRYASGYLPELDVVATVALVPPTDMRGLAAHAVNHFEDATGALVAMLGANHVWYGEQAPLSQVVTDEEPYFLASSIVDVMLSECDGGDIFDGITTVEQVYTPAWIDTLRTGGTMEPWTCFVDQSNLVGSAIPRGHDAPLLFQVSGEDELVVAEVERADFPNLCAEGYRAEYLECAGADHSEGAVDSLPYQLQWVRDRLDGVPLPQDVSCVQGEAVDCSTFTLR